MNDTLAAILQRNPTQGAYDELPTAVKQYYTPRQWSFLSDQQKGAALRMDTEPDA